MMVIVGATTPLGLMVARKLNEQNFNYLVLGDKSVRRKELADQSSIHYWHWVNYSQLNNWIEEQAAEVEFIIWCDSIYSTTNQQLFSRLWQIAQQSQIPFIALLDQESYFYRLTKEIPPPFFWTVLVVRGYFAEVKQGDRTSENYLLSDIKLYHLNTGLKADLDQTKLLPVTFTSDVVDLLFFQILSRKHSGIYHLPYQYISYYPTSSGEDNFQNQKTKDQEKSWPVEAQDSIFKLKEIGYTQPFMSIR